MNLALFPRAAALLVAACLCSPSAFAGVAEKWSVDLPIDPEPSGYAAGSLYNRAEQAIADGTGGVAVVHSCNNGAAEASFTVTWINRRGRVIYSRKVPYGSAVISANAKALLIGFLDDDR